MCVGPGGDPARGAATTITLLVVPGSSRDQVVGAHGDALRVRVTAPPEKGRANAAVIALLARALGVRPSDVEITSGHRARRKGARITGLAPASVRDVR